MSEEFTRLVIIGLGLAVAGAGFYHLATAGNIKTDVPVLGESIHTARPWPMQMDDPNIANAYNRTKYRDNTLRADELYTNAGANFTNDFLATYAPTVKQTTIPLQQL